MPHDGPMPIKFQPWYHERPMKGKKDILKDMSIHCVSLNLLCDNQTFQTFQRSTRGYIDYL